MVGIPTNEDEAGLRRLAAQINSGKLVVKLFLRHPLHAKLYLHFRPDPINPITSYLGSSNLTFAGLAKQGELNIDVLDHDACQKLARWFEDRWKDRFCLDISKELVEIINNSWARPETIPPYHIYVKMAYHLAQDREVTTPIGSAAEEFLAEVPLGDILLVSDYGKGVCTRGLLESLGKRAREAKIPILVDPARSRNWSDYCQVSLIKANWAEATEAVSCEHPRPLALARKLSDVYGCDAVITLGRYGMVCAERTGATWHLPPTPTEVRDVCGAGDTVFAALGVDVITGKKLRDACRSAMCASGRQVASIGIAFVA